ncbi:MAG: hypothetical protein JKY84_05650 [Emcibacteraceae bacterium]|nr:hypothetical protein [Emcibacteraceae bacterium]
MNIKSIQLQPIFTINEEILIGEIVAFNTTPEKSILVATALKPLDYTIVQEGWATLPKSTPEGAQSYCVYEIKHGKICKDIKIVGEKYNIHDVQLFPNDDILMVCSRTPHTPSEDFGGNGRIYSPDGILKSDILLGDAIESTQITSKGTIWTGLFDEGTFDESGLKEWSKDGNKLYEFEQVKGLDYIWDCYALNVASNNATYCYYYSQFPLVQIQDNKIINYWKIPIKGSHAFAIFEDYALFTGGYKCDNFFLIKLLESHKVEILQELELLDEDNEPLKFSRVANRGSSIFGLYGKKIYELDLHQLISTQMMA